MNISVAESINRQILLEFTRRSVNC